MLCVIYESCEKRDGARKKSVPSSLFVNNFSEKLLFKEKLVKLVRLQNRKKLGMKNAKLVSRTETEPKFTVTTLILFYSAFWHDVLWV
mgnify:CR=1 FL=1